MSQDSMAKRLRREETRETQSDSAAVISQYLLLPALRGFWPMSSIDESGNPFDMSEQDRTLTNWAGATYNYDNLAPYITFGGTDHVERLDEAGLDIRGTQATVAASVRGLTMGGWIWVTAAGTDDAFMTKWENAAASRGYRLKQGAGGPPTDFDFQVSVDGTAITTVTSDANSLTTGEWRFLVGRFDPSTELAIFLDDDKSTNVAAIPASIVNNAEAFMIGAQAPSGAAVEFMIGRASLCFLCAAALSDTIIGNLYTQSRGLFGV